MKIQVPVYEKAASRLLKQSQRYLNDGEAKEIGTINQFVVYEYVGPDPNGKEKIYHMCTVDGEVVGVTTWKNKGDYIMSKVFAIKVEYRSTGLIFDMLNHGGVVNAGKWYSSGKVSTAQMLAVGRILVQKFTDGTYPPREMHVCTNVDEISKDNKITTPEEYDELATKVMHAQVFMRTV
jgi:hypothetical protein